jgi:anaerobic selenocysteine-containing dehydrogenase
MDKDSRIKDIKPDDGTSTNVKKQKNESVNVSRRNFFTQFGLAACGLIAGTSVLPGCTVLYNETLVGEIEDGVGMDYSPTTGLERQDVPSACWQCVARDAMIAYVEDGRLAHIEGNHRLLRTNGKLCSKGQGGVNQVYDPDRLLFPMKRVAGTERGAGQWQRITWDDAIDELVQKFQAVRDDDPGKLMLHYGRMKASSSKLMKDYFLYGFGSKSNAGHTSICESCKWTSQELVWGKHYDVNDVENYATPLNPTPIIFPLPSGLLRQ